MSTALQLDAAEGMPVVSAEAVPSEAVPSEPTPSKPTPSTSSAESTSVDAAARPDTDEHLYLIGRPPLKDFVRYVRHHAVRPEREGTLTDDWRAAAEIVRELERDEAGVADDPAFTRIDPKRQPLLVEFLQDPLVQNGFNTVPTEVAIVPLDQLVVWQKHIDLTFVRRLQDKLGPEPGEADIFRACLLHDRLEPPVKWSRLHSDSFMFVSTSDDLRFLGAMKLEPKHVQGYPPPGDLVGVVGLAVGFGSNFLNAIYAEKRLILNNGSHRAYTLAAMGFTHVPCIVQHVASRDELELVASSEVRRDPDLYLKHPRPAMLRDYLNPRLRKVMAVHRRLRQITVKFEVDDGYAPAL